ncbi:copper resistance protein CopC [Pokkaliibacter sp. CJK22405]|uniref:copper resistance CopC family protein n=1 Tax=Pokkaliibacter sp. CJK22405 TaxID=3384615 RepID=UPI0039848D2A
MIKTRAAQGFRPLVLAAGMLLAGMAQAHMAMTGSQPADQQVMTSAPAALSLDFSKAVNLISVTLTDASGEQRELKVNRKARETHHEVKVPTLTAGAYQVKWTCLGGDGHKMSGNFAFSIAP